MSLLVQKFGGSSLADTACMNLVADKITAAKQKGHDVVVVLSAMGKTTDDLAKLASSIQAVPDPREYAQLLATGEQVSIALLAMLLLNRGLKARSYTAAQAGLHTDRRFKKARILNITAQHLQADLAADCIPIVAGFQGFNDRDVTLLGRGGSDITAVALAAKLAADECQIFTDVAGVFTTDPRVEPKARCLACLSFAEMIEMAGQGSKILQIRALEFAGKYRIPLRVLSTFTSEPGTAIRAEVGQQEIKMERGVVSGIAFNRCEAKISLVGIPDRPGVAHKILEMVGESDIDVDMIVQNVARDDLTDMTFTVHRDDFVQVLARIRKISEHFSVHRIEGDDKIAKLSLVGVGMRAYSGVASKMFATLAKENINIQLIATSEIKISVVIAEESLDQAVRALHREFGLDKPAIEEVDLVSTSLKKEQG